MKVTLSLDRSYAEDLSIMVDALRASTTINTALQSFKSVITAKNVADAVKLAEINQATLAGERDGAKIEGFDVGNSPLEIKNLKGEVLVLTTTNGTRVLESMQSKVLIGSFVNAQAVAQRALQLADNHIEIVMAGVKGRFVIEDFLGAGEIITHLKDEKLDEFAIASLMASNNKEEVDRAVRNSNSAEGLRALGLEKDIEFCLKRDIYDTVPIYKEGIIKAFK
ncbi:MAG: 2-phosphosulfolactate phosphatase [Methanobacterium sp.]|nr:2-phosphosulfolactate phosphatase [Methanobacterium sp.]